jgi:probable metal-binding protein
MENIHHIHEVLHLLFNTEKQYKIEELYSTLKNQFGDDVQFTSCSDNVFPVQEVIPFLLSREKIRLSDDTIIPMTPACSH